MIKLYNVSKEAIDFDNMSRLDVIETDFREAMQSCGVCMGGLRYLNLLYLTNSADTILGLVSYLESDPEAIKEPCIITAVNGLIYKTALNFLHG